MSAEDGDYCAFVVKRAHAAPIDNSAVRRGRSGEKREPHFTWTTHFRRVSHAHNARRQPLVRLALQDILLAGV